MSSMTKQYAYITTAIPYVNGLPHIGHAMDYMLADVVIKLPPRLPVKIRHLTPMSIKCTAIFRI